MIPEFNNIKDVPRKFSGECLIIYEADGKIKNPFKCWFKNGEIHKEDGPAIILENGDWQWWLNDQLHRIGGPAVFVSTQHKFCYYLFGFPKKLENYWNHHLVLNHKLKMIMDL